MKKYIFILATVLVGLTSCKSYLDINYDPNSPTGELITNDMIMPGVEMIVTTTYGDFLRITGGFFSMAYAHLNGTSNYLNYTQFEMTPTRAGSAYTSLYQRGLSNIKTMLENASADEDWGTYLAATVLRVFIYQIYVDCFGEIPYSEALDTNILYPHYDDGKDVYEGILAELDEALEKVSASDEVCTNFLYPNATASRWIQFANALKLKILMRMANVTNVQSEVAALIAEDNFPTSDVAYTSCWSNSIGCMSPFYTEEFSTQAPQTNVAANLAIIQTMETEDYTDPRLPAFFDTNSDGEYMGSVSGTQYSGSSTLTKWSRPAASYDMPVYMISVFEVEFFLAEYYARYGSATDAAAHYAKAVEASFASAGVTGADEWVARYPYDNSNYKKSLGEAKWVALCGTNPFEGYCEARRLDYPAFGTAKGSDFYDNATDGSWDTSSYVPFTFYTPIQVFGEVGDNHLLERFPYPETSTSRNSNTPDFPGYLVPIFWGE